MAGRLNMLYRDSTAHAHTLDSWRQRPGFSRARDESMDAKCYIMEWAMIDQGVTAALAARDANRSTNGDDSHNSGTGVRRTERAAREGHWVGTETHCYECRVFRDILRGNDQSKRNNKQLWFVKHQAIIVCAEKIVRIPWGNETLIVHGDGSNRGNEARLYIIPYTKTQEYMLKGCPIFLANITTKEKEDKSEKKRLEDVLIVRDFLDVFPEDLPGLPPTRQVEFQINLIPGAAPVARAP
ncbi:hypothetical protein Tco_1475618 [Tanacetum coccineum]